MADSASADPFGLERFVHAQNASGSFDRAVVELRHGRKTGHWIWYVFPQLAGLGLSSTSQRYAISGLSEARAYLAHDVLGPRLIMISQLALETAPGDSAETIFGGIDALKLRSSMTLFTHADAGEPVFAAVLDRYFDGIPDTRTEALLRHS